ncbi:MAG: DNA translocase FtsK 4TM domain-containing protein, partial [Hydrogenimonas sp.]|nr:DNA translocase FtsK 4TM domain-containing protein [Hydrogenimonas sp.]
MVGSLGTYIGTHNLELFGYFAYIDFIFLLYPLYRLYRLEKFEDFEIESFSAWLLFLFSLLILQALVIKPPMNGWIGGSIVSFLHPFIGDAGVWLFWLMTLTLSGVILWGESIHWKTSDIKEMMQQKDERKPLQLKPMSIVAKEEDSSGDEVNETISKSKNIDALESESEKEDENAKTLSEEEPNQELKKQKSSEKIEDEKKSEHANIEIVKEIEENKKLLEQIDKGEQEKPKNFKLPKLDFLQKPPKRKKEINEAEIDAKISDLLEKLAKFKIEGDVVRTYAGPVVTTFEFKPAAHIKVSKILNLQDDLAMALRAQTIRIQAPVPGKDVVGIEIPNREVETIYLREILEDEIFTKSKSPLTIALGKDIVGKPFVTDLKRLPHLLIAGTTGSGKSVGINAMILSLLYRNSPDNLKLMMIDPKMLEFSIYNDIPHLLTPVITQPKKAITALSNMVGEMERRYQLMSQTKTKNIESYNEKAKKQKREELP